MSSPPIDVRLGSTADVDAAVSVYLRSNLVRRHGRQIPDERVAQVTASLRSPDTWFLIASDGHEPVAMASAMPAREDAGAGPLIPGACYLDLVFVVPERWREGIGGMILDAVVDEAQRRGYSQIQLWTHEDNERAQHLYRSRGFAPMQLTHLDGNGDVVREWARDLAAQRVIRSAADRSGRQQL